MTAPSTRARDVDHHREGLRRGGGARRPPRLPSSAPALIALALAERRRPGWTHRSSPRSTTSSTTAPCCGSGSSMQPTDRPRSGGVDRRRRALPQFGGRPHGSCADRTGPGGDRRELGPARRGRRRRRAAPFLDHPVGRRVGVLWRGRRASWWMTSLPSSVASSGCSTARIPPWPTPACWPGTTPSPERRRIPPSPGSCGDLVDDTLEVAEFPAALGRRRSRTRPCTGSPTRRSATRARRSEPTDRASCPSGCSPLSPPAAYVARHHQVRRRGGHLAGGGGGVDVRGLRASGLEDPMAIELRAAAAARPNGLQGLSRVALGDTVFATEVASMLER